MSTLNLSAKHIPRLCSSFNFLISLLLNLCSALMFLDPVGPWIWSKLLHWKRRMTALIEFCQKFCKEANLPIILKGNCSERNTSKQKSKQEREKHPKHLPQLQIVRTKFVINWWQDVEKDLLTAINSLW